MTFNFRQKANRKRRSKIPLGKIPIHEEKRGLESKHEANKRRLSIHHEVQKELESKQEANKKQRLSIHHKEKKRESESKQERRLSIRKGKRPIQEEKRELTVKKIRATITDDGRYKGPNFFYRVITWTNIEDRCKTKGVSIDIDEYCCKFNQTLEIPVESHEQYLYVELLRESLGFHEDLGPGTSNGIVVIGRAKIKLPKETGLDKLLRKRLTVDLVGFNDERCLMVKGTLDFSWELNSYEVI